jgi:spore coat polysaccharide biosynthesis protein SpsF (cytidylyltransferase family)
VIDKVIHAFHAGEYDYVSNTLEPSYPDGLDTEVFLREALGRAWRAATLRSEREHVTPYIWEHPTLFRLANVTHVSDLSSLRWTVDEPEDLEFVRRVVGHLTRVPSFGMAEVLDLLREHPELSEINTGRVRNEGFRKSLCEDKAGAERETP